MNFLTRLIDRFPALLALILGGLAALGFAPFSLWPLTPLAVIGLFQILISHQGHKKLLRIGFGFGFGHFFIMLLWIPQPFYFQDAMPVWFGWPALALLCLFLACYPLLAIYSAKWLAGEKPLALIPALAACWAISEMLRATLFTGFAWNPLGIALVDFAYPARWVGSYGLSALLILTAGGFWLLLSRNWKPGLLLSLPLILLWSASYVLLSTNGLTLERSATRLTIVQNNMGQDRDWYDPVVIQQNRESLLRLSRDLTPDDLRPRILFWSEGVINSDPLEDGYPSYFAAPNEARAWRKLYTSPLRPGDMLITGGAKFEFDDRPRLVSTRNSVFAIGGDGALIGRYDKFHLVPYGEYLPFEEILGPLGLDKLTEGKVPFTPGPGPRSLDLGSLGKVGIQVCYEIIFSGETIDRNDRPDFMFNPSTDDWFGQLGPPQQVEQARLRAIEENLPVIRATPTGISTVIDRFGIVLESIPWHEEGRIDADLPPPGEPTLFSRMGYIAPIALSLILLLIAVALRRSRR
ncbi:apolipoprotein N-acyltransferase [Alterisphingorhabdus coralli]|uniref:Apolipoprotein N-acyltransferase n=1 Tax=Alterisphingorhabdus coralli TaxID=3071408 RepID=A0AA97I2D7_9SPHN|nr:apolipoprotein N-acyltransferase [Parasphingorhabdus sp. SCSIO 66989]WOE75665.1 apolipoprotein N-acyltransferase [Parasphingorhabdus sp. SCSIO 66989]